MADFGGLHGHHSHFEPHLHKGALEWLSVAGMSIMIIGLISINISLFPTLKSLHERRHNKCERTRGLKMAVFSALCIVALTLAAIFSCISTVMVLIYSDFNHQLIIDDILIKFSLSLYSGCQTSMIYVFTMRVDAVFSNTSVGYSRRVLNTLYILCFVFGILYIFFITTLIFELWDIYYVVAIIWIVVYFSLSLTLCMLFVRKVERLMVNASAIDPDLLHVILKSGILVPLSICSSFIFFMVMLCIIYVFSPGEWNAAGIFWIVVDCTVSSICLFLLFASNNVRYNKYCGCIHQYCEKRKISGIEKKMVRREERARNEASRTKSRTATGTTTNGTGTVSSQAVSIPVPAIGTLEKVISDSVALPPPSVPSSPLVEAGTNYNIKCT